MLLLPKGWLGPAASREVIPEFRTVDHRAPHPHPLTPHSASLVVGGCAVLRGTQARLLPTSGIQFWTPGISKQLVETW